MAILIYRIRNDSFSFPYPRDLLAVFDDEQYQAVHTFTTLANNQRRSDWVTKLTTARDESFNWDTIPDGVRINPPLIVEDFRMPGEML